MESLLSSLPSSVVLLALALVVIHRLYVQTTSIRQLRPPGPRGAPLFGNTLQIPLAHFATYLKNLHSQHGGFIYLNINRQHVFSIGDIDLATELLERRSALYSSRPTVPTLDRYLDPEGLIWVLAKPGENHFWGRKISIAVMKHVRAGHSEPLQRLEALSLTNNLLEDNGKNWYEHINGLAANTLAGAMFGVNSVSGQSSQVEKLYKLTERMTTAADPSFSIINLFPFLDDIVPGFLPTPWRTAARGWMEKDLIGWNELFLEALEGKGAQMSTWAMMFTDENKDRRHLLAQFSGAAIETTATVLKSFPLVCLVYPEWIEEAQAELDRVVGKDRLPNFQDRESLPIIEAVVRELIRWNPPVRAGFPHTSTADDVVEYEGKEYFIPRGSAIYCPAYVMERDAKRYPNPDVFHPRRFLDEKGQLKEDYRTTSFGFGRRLCVGIPFAERTLWISIANMLWTFNIRKAIDPLTGSPFKYSIEDDVFDGRVTNAPFAFPVDFEPRDEQRVLVARKEWEDCEKDLNVLLPPLKRG